MKNLTKKSNRLIQQEIESKGIKLEHNKEVGHLVVSKEDIKGIGEIMSKSIPFKEMKSPSDDLPELEAEMHRNNLN